MLHLLIIAFYDVLGSLHRFPVLCLWIAITRDRVRHHIRRTRYEFDRPRLAVLAQPQGPPSQTSSIDSYMPECSHQLAVCPDLEPRMSKNVHPHLVQGPNTAQRLLLATAPLELGLSQSSGSEENRNRIGGIFVKLFQHESDGRSASVYGQLGTKFRIEHVQRRSFDQRRLQLLKRLLAFLRPHEFPISSCRLLDDRRGLMHSLAEQLENAHLVRVVADQRAVVTHSRRKAHELLEVRRPLPLANPLNLVRVRGTRAMADDRPQALDL